MQDVDDAACKDRDGQKTAFRVINRDYYSLWNVPAYLPGLS